MSGSVSIDIDALSGAISALTGLAGRIDSQRNAVVSGTPIELPSLSEGTLGAVSAWLNDQEPELSTRLDLARLLASEGAKVVSYTTDADTLANVQQMLGHEMAERVNEVSYDTKPEDLEELNEILGRRQFDTKVMAEMYTDLEPQGTARAISMLEANAQYGGGGDVPMEVAKTLRQGLATASKEPSFSAESYGHEMVRWFVAPMLNDDEQDWMSEHEMPIGSGASLLSFMMRDVDYDPRFLTGAADTLDEFEKLSKDGPLGDASVWYVHNGYSYFNEGESTSYADPMAEMMRAMSRQPEVGYDFITGEGRADFYFDKRDWSNDGYDGIAALADRVSTDPEIYRQHPHEAATIASQFVDWTANSEGFNAEDAKAASDSVSHLLSSYMPSMAAALDGGGNDGEAGVLEADLELPGYGELKNMPEFFRPDLVNMTGVAMSTEDGMANLAGGVADYRQTQLTDVADRLAQNPNDAKLHTELQSTMLNDSELRAFTTKIAGDNEISEAHETDTQRQFWTNLLSEGAKQIPIKPPVVGTVVEHGIDLGTGAINDAWANTAEGVSDEWNVHAENGIGQMNYESYASLVQAGVVPMNEVPDAFQRDGEILGWNDIDQDDRSSFGSRAAGELSPWVPDELLEDTYRSRFETFFDDPGGTKD